MQKREVILTELKPEFVEEYRCYHKEVWPELEAVYQKAGYCEMSCFLNGTKLIVFIAYDEKKLNARRRWLASQEVIQQWDALMEKFKDNRAEKCLFGEIYRLPSATSEKGNDETK